MKNMRLVTLLVFGLVLFSTSASAQQSTPSANKDKSPVFALVAVGDYPNGYFDDVVMQPGESKGFAVRVMNAGEVDADLLVFKANASSAIDGGFTAGEEEDDPIGSTDWVNFATTTVHLAPGESQDIAFNVVVPEDTQPGQYISGLVAKTVDSFAFPGTNVLDYSMGYSISVGILVAGELSISFSLGEPSIQVLGTTRVLDIPVENTGNYLVRPVGSVSMSDGDGNQIAEAPIEMGSVYAGLTTSVQISIPDQLSPGKYFVTATLSDPKSGEAAEANNAPVTIEEPIDPTGVFVESATIEPNAEAIVFANVDVTLENGGQQIPASDVTLEVLRDGEAVDSFPLATNQVLLSGENTYTTRYIPAEMWKPGTYTFQIVVSAVDPNGGQETILLTEGLDATIEVP